jgi:hypothetical protein
MKESTPSSSWDHEGETTLHTQKHKPSITRCRRELQSSFNAVKNVKEPRDKARNRESKVNHYFAYPRCSTCTDRAPGRLRKFAVSVCNVCNVRLCTTCTRKHRTNFNEHLVSPISPKLDVEEHFLTRNGHHPLVCYEAGHKDIPKYFCETCQYIICLECIQTRHKKHEFVYAKDAYGKHKVALEKHIQNARTEAGCIVKQLDRGMFSQFVFKILFGSLNKKNVGVVYSGEYDVCDVTLSNITHKHQEECVYFRAVTLETQYI